MAHSSEIGKFRRSYKAKLQLGEDDQTRINPLHLQISESNARLLKKSNDDNTFVCAIRVSRNPEVMEKPLGSNSSFPSTSTNQFNTSPKRSIVSTSVVTAEDIIVCVWAVTELSLSSPPLDDEAEGRSLSIDGDSSDDDSDNHSISLKCTKYFLCHYNISETDHFYIRSIEVFPLSKAIFSVSTSDTYDWLQQDKFSGGLMEEICNHDLLVRKNDILLAPYPQLFLDDPDFKRDWYFNIKAIACAPFQMGLIKPDTEIIIYFEKALTHLPTKHRHLSGPHLEQYVDLQNGLMISDFCRSMSMEMADAPDSVITTGSSFNDFFICSSFVIQQKIHWNKVLLQDEDVDFIDLTTAVGMPFKLMKRYGIIKGTIMKITLYQKDLTGDINRDDVKKFLKQEKLKQKFVRVYPLTKRLDDTDVLFISSLLLFNLQKEPPVIKSPLLILEKPSIPRVGSESEIDGGHQLYRRSVSTQYNTATEVLIKIINSPSYPPQAKHEESLSKYFQIPRLLNVGDVFVVNSTDDPEFWQEPAVETGARKPVIFFKVFSIAPHQPESFPLLADVNNTSLKQVGSDHSFVPLSASKYLSHCDAVYGQSIVCPGLDKYVTKLENFVLPYIYKRHRVNTLVPSVIVSGSKGCGKRIIINTVARRLYMHILEVNCHDIVSDIKSESRITSIFDSAIRYWPCIILMRNIDVIGREKEGATFENPRIINIFFNNVRKLVGQSNPIVIIATTSNTSGLSEDLLPAFLHQINIESPNEMERADIIKGLLENCVISPDISIGHLSQRTAGFVLGDLTTLILQAKQKTYEKVLKICCPEEKPASLQLEEDIVTAGLVMEQSDIESALDAMQSAHSDSIGAPKIPSVKWDDIGGLDDVKADIIDTVQLPLQHPELLAAGLRRSGVLLYGPPGTGKTLLAKAVATECSLNFLSVKGPELINMYVGQSEENVREVFKRARNASPCVIFFDELDSLAPNRGRSGDSGGVMDRVVSQLLAELDGLHQSSDVFVIGATNRPDLLDPALLRPGRFDKLLYLGVSSNTQSQLNILKALTSKFKLSPQLKLIDVAEKCPPNLTGADLYALCADAMLSAMRRKIESLEAGKDTDQTKLEVDAADFDTALSALVPSVSQAELEKYEQIRASFQP